MAGAVPEGRDDVYAYFGSGWAMLRTRRHKYLRYDSTGGEVLYDLGDEPHEVVNRAGDARYQPVLDEMRRRMLSRTLQAARSPRPRHHLY